MRSRHELKRLDCDRLALPGGELRDHHDERIAGPEVELSPHACALDPSRIPTRDVDAVQHRVDPPGRDSRFLLDHTPGPARDGDDRVCVADGEL